MRKMDKVKRTAATLVIALIVTTLLAQAGTMGNGAQQRIMAVVNRCKAMPHDQMMHDQGCTSTMAQHPELFSGGTPAPANATRHQ